MQLFLYCDINSQAIILIAARFKADSLVHPLPCLLRFKNLVKTALYKEGYLSEPPGSFDSSFR